MSVQRICNTVHLELSSHAVSKDFRVDIKSDLVGAYNVSNCLAALTATVYGLGIAPEIAARGIASLEGIPGRMEQIDLGQNFIAIVDFAHTPNALKVTLEAARPHHYRSQGSEKGVTKRAESSPSLAPQACGIKRSAA